MNEFLQSAIHRFLGFSNQDAAPYRNDLQLGNLLPSVVVSLNRSKSTRDDLASQGYINTRHFVALPSLTSPRWLFPLGKTRCALEGLQIYKPYARIPRIMKGLLTAIVAARCQDLAPNRVLVASRALSPLEGLVGEVTGERHPVFALSLGAEMRFRKLTAQVMRPDGEILGYIKLPLTDAAVERVRHEAKVVSHLWSVAVLRSHIPRVLYSGDWGDSYILFQSEGPSRPGPAEFNSQCEEFLHLLSEIQKTEKPGHALLEEVAARWCKEEPTLESGWRALGQAVLAMASRELDGVMIPSGVMHGDFAPWNTRIGDHGLYVFDWESASWDAPILWDAFHFKTQLTALLNKKDSVHITCDRRSGERASYLLYLLSSACRLFGEDSPTLSVGLECRRQLLAKQLKEG